MHRSAWNQLSPWIERMIQNYSTEEESRGRVRLKAHVTNVGQMSQSQAQNLEGPIGMLFLSDGVVQIPAILTSALWEELQENWEMECFTSLLNNTVSISDYRLQFHMGMESTRCRFFLSVGELVSNSAGTVKERMPCCTSLPSVRQKIFDTWRSLVVQDRQESQNSQTGFDLTELLGQWQEDFFQTVMDDIQEKLTGTTSRQPSTSLTQPGLFSATRWDAERVQDKGLECFSVPMKCLLVPDRDEQSTNVAILTPDADEELDLHICDRTQSPVHAAEGQTETHTGGEEENIWANDRISLDMINKDIIPLENPWHFFPAPFSLSASSDESRETTHEHLIPPQQEKGPENSTSTQLTANAQSEGSTSQHSKEDHSVLPPFQKEPPSSGNNNTETQHVHAASQEKKTFVENVDTLEVTVETQHRKSKRKRELESVQKAHNTVVVEEEEDVCQSVSPPSWLFDSVVGSGTDDGSVQAQNVSAERRKTSTVHSDGRLFSYTYTVSGQDLHDFAQFKVEDALLHWAVKYLVVPKQATHL
ncbi:adrenocortical dysplasia protein homolog [Nerophis ophidion]|uniref:adrenocortical dysplasia protein homolog n=1 Tax=Nerophis ophidion TaxID=159077 RepID=UPI002ADFB24B|nr:adrenocortical dysplasia protein homolog [Nerophis ophidion]XP_061773326.1 adrenocortical dysplasia protein homolog [Nerophis ophidion]XP_061773327.1 adrenocortical dysplasia protein homolog [Nerophis ophidion]XP_061773328.1 adrenocortical dysplasia protein homolog [Nerophis ophidion]